MIFMNTAIPDIWIMEWCILFHDCSDKKSVLHNASDDDGEANTYDYQDSFINDASQTVKDSVDSVDPAKEANGEEGGEEEEEEEAAEDVKALVKEAKGFMKNKKMQKPTANTSWDT